jgi:hypothetical protein
MNAGKTIWTVILLSSLLCAVQLQGQTAGLSVNSITVPDGPSPVPAVLKGSASEVADKRTETDKEAPTAQTAPASTQAAHPHRSHQLRKIVIITVAVTVMVVVLASLDK